MLSRLLTPSSMLYLIVMLAFSGVTVFLGQYLLAGIELGVAVALFAVSRFFASRRKKEILRYMQSTTASLGTALKDELPFPMAILSIANNEIFWANSQFSRLTGLRSTAFSQKIESVLPNFSARWLAEGKTEYPADYELGGRRYRIVGNQIHSDEHDPSLFLSSIYLVDMTELFQVRDEYIHSRPVVSIILIDNYDELVGNLPDSVVSNLNAQIDNKLTEWTDGISGILRKIERNRYFFLFEERDLKRLSDGRFSILETIHGVTNPSGVAATISLGIGKDGANFLESYNFASLSIEMSLSRGGDQAVIKDRYNFSFFGGRTKETERRTKVKSRVIASSLSELIAQSSSVFLMGHRNSDIDSIGAAAGLQCICRKKGRQAKIVIDLEQTSAGALIDLLKPLPEYEDCFISGEDALLMADPRSLLIVVDTNRPDQVQFRPLLESVTRVAVIDHHRRAADYIEQVVLNLHEPFVSSASELVTELLQYAVEPQDILPAEAQALLAGIVLDTKNFSVRTGSRTFEAAAFLRRTGADTVDVKKLFQNDLPATIARYQIIQTARLYRREIAIAALDHPTTRTIAAQAADELLNISGIQTSFVLYPSESGEIIVSARSIGEANVQMILEPLGGGGNAATAGAQVKDKPVRDVLRDLVASIDKYYEE